MQQIPDRRVGSGFEQGLRGFDVPTLRRQVECSDAFAVTRSAERAPRVRIGAKIQQLSNCVDAAPGGRPGQAVPR